MTVPTKYRRGDPARLEDAVKLSENYDSLSETVRLSEDREAFIDINLEAGARNRREFGHDAVLDAPTSEREDESLRAYYDTQRARGHFRDTTFELFKELHVNV